jgi:uncharacterized metal-binding protein
MTGARAAALVLLLAALLVAPSAAPSAQPGDPVSAIDGCVITCFTSHDNVSCLQYFQANPTRESNS